jgi:predicted Zn-dependent protease
MFPVAPTDADLAVVLGHEVAHVSAGHGNERMSQAVLAGLVGLGVNEGLSKTKLTDEQQKIFMAVFSAGATLGVLLPYSRTQEAEADHIGLLYAARAGYDPHVAVPFWQRMASQSAAAGGGPPVFLSDHPSDASRIAALQEEMPQAAAEYQQALANGGP